MSWTFYYRYYCPVRTSRFKVLLMGNRTKQISAVMHHSTHKGRHPSVTEVAPDNQTRIRNLGVIAHIDAGKTTTTERMLYLSGRTRALGEVDCGNTVTDFMIEERERGISIMSAAACFTWRNHDIHLIDTPGHVDFTLEVERSLAVVDSALTIIDACKGVETQTRTVWNQADKHNLPRIIYLNKMDRLTADLKSSLESLRQRFGKKRAFIPLQSPVFLNTNKGRQIIGLVELPTLTLKIWFPTEGVKENKFSSVDLHSVLSNEPKLPLQFSDHKLPNISLRDVAMIAIKARDQMLSNLAELDDNFAEEYILLDKPQYLLPSEPVRSCIRKLTLEGKCTPVLLGSSKNSIGVQPILDAIVDYLPNPSECLPPPIITHFLRHISKDHSLSSKISSIPILLVFKILFDPQHSPLTLARVYSGHITIGTNLFNWTREQEHSIDSEKVTRILQLTGDSYESLNSIGPGNIVALSGLQSTRTGDLLSPMKSSNQIINENFSDLVIPQPVVHAALEPQTGSSFRNLEQALVCTQREDPSFTANFNTKTGQWVVGGMGDLHLEVVLSRLRREYKLDVVMGPLITAYQEVPKFSEGNCLSALSGLVSNSGVIGNKSISIIADVEVKTDDVLTSSNKLKVIFDKGWNLHESGNSVGDFLQNSALWKKTMANIRTACESASATGGPLLRSRVVGISIHIRTVGQLNNSKDTGDINALQLPIASQSFASFSAVLRSTVSKAVRRALHNLPDWCIMEPVMNIEIRLPLDEGSSKDSSVAPFIGEVCKRRGEVIEVDIVDKDDFNECLLRAYVPLAELKGFSTTIRSMSSGLAEINLNLADYRPVSIERQEELIHQTHWFSTTKN